MCTFKLEEFAPRYRPSVNLSLLSSLLSPLGTLKSPTLQERGDIELEWRSFRSPDLGRSNTQTGGADGMSESIESMMAMLKALRKEQQAQVGQVMQRISGMEEQLRGSAS